MRVLHIIDTLGLGGAQTLLKDVAESQKDNQDLFVFPLRSNSTVRVQIDHPNVLNLGSVAGRLSLKSLWELKKVVQTNRIEVLHCHLVKSQLFGWLLKLVWFPKIVLVQHEHGKIFRKLPLYSLFVRISSKQTNTFVAISNAVAKELRAKGVTASKIQTLYNPVNLSRYYPDTQEGGEKVATREHFGIPHNKFVAGFAARIVERKGWRDFVDAAVLVHSTCADTLFMIAGSGEEAQKLKAYIRNVSADAFIQVVGYVADMRSYYVSLDCFVIPSHWEPMGLTELEAQACGVPVVAANVPGLNEVVQHNETGLLFEAGNARDLARKVNLLVGDVTLREKLIRGGMREVQNYSLPSYVEKLSNLYGELVEE